MELGRSAPMLPSASPGRAAAMVPAPLEGREVRGHRQDRQILQHRQWGRSPALAQRCGSRGSERSAEFGRVDHDLCPHARARGARRFQQAPTQTDLLGRRRWCRRRFVGQGGTGSSARSPNSCSIRQWAKPTAASAPIGPSSIVTPENLRTTIPLKRNVDVGQQPLRRPSQPGRVDHDLCPHARARMIGKQGDC